MQSSYFCDAESDVSVDNDSSDSMAVDQPLTLDSIAQFDARFKEQFLTYWLYNTVQKGR